MHFKNLLIIHKEKTKDCLMSVLSLYTQLNFKSNILHQNNPKYKYYCKNEVGDLYLRFWSHSKNLQSCIIKFENSKLRLEFLNLIIHSCSFYKWYIAHPKIIWTLLALKVKISLIIELCEKPKKHSFAIHVSTSSDKASTT